MSINDKIEAAWEEQIPNARKWLQCSRESQLLRAAGFGFEEGYRAALRSLYVEVKPEEMRLETTYLFWIDGQWREERCVLVELLELLARKAEKILKLSLPSPSEIFGEEGV